MHAGLAQLVEAELLYQRGRPPRARYIFKHALIQDAAYASLLKSTRQQVHQQIAQVLEARFPALVETQPELVAQHYTAAGCYEQAVHYWQRAGQHASERSAVSGSHQPLSPSGSTLLKTLPETPEHTQQALTLHIALGAALLMTARACAAPEVEHAYTQAYALCQQVGETPELVPVLFGLWRFYLDTATVAHSARDRGDAAAPGATCRRPRARRHRPLCPRGDGVLLLARCRLPASTWRKASHTTRQTSAVRRCSASGQDPGVGCRAYARGDLLVPGVPGASPGPPPRGPGVGARAVASL